jgi:predicted membrane chloride channel (bestrophin family)
VFPVRYEQDLYMLFRTNLVFKRLNVETLNAFGSALYTRREIERGIHTSSSKTSPLATADHILL